MNEVEITWLATDEIVMRDGASIGNTFRCLDYVPGSSIRGALAGLWLRQRSPDRRFHEIFERDVRFLDATPESTGDRRTFPIPRSIQRCKHGGADGNVVDAIRLADEGGSTGELPCPGGVEFIDGWIDEKGERAVVKLVARGQTATQSGRSTALDQSLRFRETIPAGTKFRSLLRGEPAAIDELLDTCDLRTSRSIRVGEGRSSRRSLEIDAVDRRVYKGEFGVADVLVYVLASRAVLLDDHLRPTDQMFPTDSEDLILDTDPVSERPLVWPNKLSTVAGWNSGQGLPKPNDVVLGRGSVTVAIADDPHAIEFDGIGHRRSEGFGEIRALTRETHASLAEALSSAAPEENPSDD